MYTIESINRLSDWFFTTGYSFWKIYDSDKGDRKAILDNFKDEQTPEDGLRTLIAALDNYAGSGIRCYIWAIDKPLNTKGGKYTWFYLHPTTTQPTPNNIQGIGGIPVGYISASDVESKINEALEKAETKREIEQLKKDLAEKERIIREAEPGALDRVIGRLEPFLPGIISGIFGQQINVPISGSEIKQPTNEKDIEITEEDGKRLNESLTNLYSKFPNLPDILEKLSKADPEMLKQAINFL